jgi:hypothetical protein
MRRGKVRSELSNHFDSLKAMVDNGSLMTASVFKQSRNLFFSANGDDL